MYIEYLHQNMLLIYYIEWLTEIVIIAVNILIKGIVKHYGRLGEVEGNRTELNGIIRRLLC